MKEAQSYLREEAYMLKVLLALLFSLHDSGEIG